MTIHASPLFLAGVVAAGAGQALGKSQPWFSCACFLAGMLCFVIADRRLPVPDEAACRPPLPTPCGAWVLVAGGCAACLAAGVGVYRGMAPHITHGLWFFGLFLFIVCALWLSWRARGRQRQQAMGRTIAAWMTLLAICAVVFAWRVTEVPPEVHGDDAEVGNDALMLLEERPFNLFRTGWFQLPRFHAAPTALGLELFGTGLAGLRGTSVALGTASVLLLFSVLRRLWGFEAALLSGVLLASARFFIHLSRTGFHYVDTPFLSLLVIWLFLRLWYEQRLSAAIWCGIALGLGVQTYYASRLVPVLFAITWFLWLRHEPREHLPARVGQLVLIVIVALATFAPMAGYFARDPYALWMRTEQTSVFGTEARRHLEYGYATDSLAQIILIQLRAALTLFNFSEDSSEQYGHDAPMFDPITGVLFALGFAGSCGRLRRRTDQLLLLWLLAPVIIGGALTVDAPFYPRVSGAVPFAVSAAALALYRACAPLQTWVLRAVGVRTGRSIVIIAVAIIGAINFHSYFFEYAPSRHLSPGVKIAAWVREHGAGKTTYMVGGAPHFYIKHGTIRFLTHGYDTADIIDLEQAVRTQELNRTTSVFVVMPRAEALLPYLSDLFGPVEVTPVYHSDGRLDFFGVVPQEPRNKQ